jgi:hypothetical protein
LKTLILKNHLLLSSSPPFKLSTREALMIMMMLAIVQLKPVEMEPLVVMVTVNALKLVKAVSLVSASLLIQVMHANMLML